MSKLDVDKMKDPFVWLKPVGDCDAEEKPFGFTNPLRACYEEIAPPLVEKPKAPRTPLAPIRTTTWDPGQGMKGARYPTFVPLPLPGTTPVTSATARVPRGESGKNTMVNLIVDVSGSMGATAASWRGYSFARWEVARICAAIMLKQCQIGDDAFAIYEFESHPHVLWKGPSYAHSDAIDYIQVMIMVALVQHKEGVSATYHFTQEVEQTLPLDYGNVLRGCWGKESIKP